MPTMDMPLDRLRTYQGRNPRPADFDEYWDAAVSEMHALGTGCELVPAQFQVPGVVRCYDMYFTGVGGARVHAKYLLPERRTGRVPAVLRFHGYSGSSGADWLNHLGYAGAGMAVLALDCRGQAGESEDCSRVSGNTQNGHIIRGLLDAPERLYYRAQFLDTAQLARIAMAQPEIDPERVGAQGHSQGGALTLACAALEPAVCRIAPGKPFLSDYQRVWEMDRDQSAYTELRWFFRTYDPQHEHEQDVFTRLGYIDVHHLAPRIRAQVLMFIGLMDGVCPPSTQFAVYNAISAPKQLELYPDFGHEDLPGAADKAFMFLRGM